MERLREIIRLRRRSIRVGTFLWSTKVFKVPTTVRVLGKRVPLKLPDEPGMKTAFLELLVSDVYELERMPTGLKTVIDIGANAGIFCVAARNRFPKSIIHAYEPNQSLVPFLSSQAAETGAQVFLEAVALEAGSVRLDLGQESVLSSTHLDPSGTIRACAFRDAIGRLGGKADLVKMDCEGAEWDLFDDTVAWQSVRFVTMEYHQTAIHSDVHSEIVKSLKVLGFEVRHQHKQYDGTGTLIAERLDPKH